MHHIGGPELDASDILLSDGGGRCADGGHVLRRLTLTRTTRRKYFDARESFLADNKLDS
jgi:hypothetical protein